MMRRFIHPRLLVACALVAALPAFAEGNYKAEALNRLPASDVPKVLQEALQSQGARFLDDQGNAVAEVWLAKTVSGAASPNSSMDVLYGSVAPGALVGVLHFPNGGKDFRGQDVKTGYYTMRYELVPQDGNHMGVSQYRDFILLIPVAQDPDPAQALKFEDAVRLSRQTTGTGHPAVLSMDPVGKSMRELPSAFRDDASDWALAAKTQVKPQGGEAKDLPIAVILIGKYEG